MDLTFDDSPRPKPKPLAQLLRLHRGSPDIADTVERCQQIYAKTLEVGDLLAAAAGPQNLLITPDGRWLLCANMPGNSLVVFGIDPSTGALTPKGEPVSIPMPSCIRWLK